MRPVDIQSEIPLYYQVKEIIKEKILSKTWPPGKKLPSEHELMEMFEVSRITIRQAILELVHQGLLYRRQGKGTFVAEAKVEADFVKMFFPEELSNEHHNIDIKAINPPSSVAQSLSLSEEELVYRLIRIRFFNGEAAVLEKSYVPVILCPKLIDHKPTGKLYQYLSESYGVQIDRAETYVEPIIIGNFEAKLFGIKKGTPALQLSRRNFSGEIPIVVTDSIIRGDRCRLILRTEEK